ncbi:unnamed protein product [Dicrocoelium dendriticum]|nr:unnamed protein product [Dicrocoelium dendriticum]
MSRRDANRTVVKLELYFERTQKTSDDKLTLHSTYASKLRKSHEKCLYPVQIRPRTSFYEPSNYDWPERGYSFNVYLNRRLQTETESGGPCKAMEEQSTLSVAKCKLIRSGTTRHLQIVTSGMQDGVLNVMTQLMKDLNEENPTSCTANVALRVRSKDIS